MSWLLKWPAPTSGHQSCGHDRLAVQQRDRPAAPARPPRSTSSAGASCRAPGGRPAGSAGSRRRAARRGGRTSRRASVCGEISKLRPIRIAAPPSAASNAEPLARPRPAAPGDEAPDHQDQAAGVAEQRRVAEPGVGRCRRASSTSRARRTPRRRAIAAASCAARPPAAARFAAARTAAAPASASATRQNPAATGPLSASRTNHGPSASAALPTEQGGERQQAMARRESSGGSLGSV